MSHRTKFHQNPLIIVKVMGLLKKFNHSGASRPIMPHEFRPDDHMDFAHYRTMNQKMFNSLRVSQSFDNSCFLL